MTHSQKAADAGLQRSRAAALGLVFVVVAIVIFAVASDRTYLGTGTETDFTSTYGPEAQRILNGEPLWVEYHPPAYPFALALAKLVTDSWLCAALWISGLAALLLMLSGFTASRHLGGVAAGWGALIACVCSAPFQLYASTASSDVPFAALCCTSLALAVSASSNAGGWARWAATGFVAGLALLTRTNGLAMAFVIAAPLFLSAPWSKRMRDAAIVAAAFAVPLAAWATYAHVTHSPLSPTENYINLAVSAYGDGTDTYGDTAAAMEERFEDTADVLAYDPAGMARQFAMRLLELPVRLVRTMTWPPIALLAIPGLLLLWRRRGREAASYAVVILALTALSGLAPWHKRFFIFLVPTVGALAGIAVAQLLERARLKPAMRAALIVLLSCGLALIAWRAHSRVLPALETSSQREFAEAIPQVRRLTPSDATLYASTYGLAFETGRAGELIPSVDTLAELYDELCGEIAPGASPYLFLGSMERSERFRKALTTELTRRPLPWLRLMATGHEERWQFYRILMEDCSR